MCDKDGAGVLPYCVHEQHVWFLFHQTFMGKKVGTLIDFGGATEAGEGPKQTAAREFAEETLGIESTKELIEKSTKKLAPLLETAPVVAVPTYKYQFFVPQIDYVNLDSINRIFEDFSNSENSSKIERRRRFVWVRGDSVLNNSAELPFFVRVTIEFDALKKICLQLYQKHGLSV